LRRIARGGRDCSDRAAHGFLRLGLRACSDHALFNDADRLIDGYEVPADSGLGRYVIVSTQGRGDTAALKSALATPSA
jgi:xanthine dehydrogenase accessory factor